LILHRAFTVAGRFVDAEGTPIAEGSVRADSASCRRDVRLGGDGRFSLDLPPAPPAPSTPSTSPTPPDTASTELLLRSPRTEELRIHVVAGQAGETRDLGDLRAPRGATVTGRVVRDDGNPLPGARIWTPRQGPDGPAVAWAARDLLEATAGEDGRFRLSGLLPMAAVLRVESVGFARAQLSLPLNVREDEGGGAIEVGTITLTAGASLRVRVGDSSKPVEGAVARADLGNRWLEPDLLTAQVVDGEAILPNVPAGRVRVSVVAGRKLLCEQLVDVPEAGEQGVDCRHPALAVSGLVRVGGLPASGGALVWTAPDLEIPGRIDTTVSPGGLRQSHVTGGGRPPVDVAVGPTGEFQTAELVPGDWRVSWIFQGSLSAPLSVTLPEVPSFTTVLPFAGMALAGIVTDRQDRPVEGAQVRELESGALAVTGAGGRFFLASVPPGKLVVQARKLEETSPALETEVLPGKVPEPLHLVLGQHETPSVAVQVVDAGGAPVPGAFVFFEEEGKGQRLLTTGADGNTSASLEAPLPPRVRVAAFSGRSWAFGSWAGREAAQSEGLVVATSGAGGSALVRSAKRHGSPRVMTAEGWDLSWLLRLLGAPPMLSPDSPLALTGLPAGQYRVELDGANVVTTISEGRPGEAVLE
ncbi:MAG: carboxypeptidase-like regulatory domain-containing protein, partial [Acidobacteriota bacterium]|nr:carboxypeptidase-like regulatory domain-containing protein [Acidobacteriota bacterium]